MAGLGLISAFSACDKMPLLAPGGTVITIFPATTTVPLNGEVEIVATVIENGTTAAAPSTPGNGNNGGQQPGGGREREGRQQPKQDLPEGDGQ